MNVADYEAIIRELKQIGEYQYEANDMLSKWIARQGAFLTAEAARSEERLEMERERLQIERAMAMQHTKINEVRVELEARALQRMKEDDEEWATWKDLRKRRQEKDAAAGATDGPTG